MRKIRKERITVKQKLLKMNHRLTNLRQNYVHQITIKIIKRESSFICIEDLNVKGTMKNKHLSKAVGQQSFGEFRSWNSKVFLNFYKFSVTDKCHV